MEWERILVLDILKYMTFTNVLCNKNYIITYVNIAVILDMRIE